MNCLHEPDPVKTPQHKVVSIYTICIAHIIIPILVALFDIWKNDVY